MVDSWLSRRFRESRRCSRDTFPESCITEHTLVYEMIKLLALAAAGLHMPLLRGWPSHADPPRSVSEQDTQAETLNTQHQNSEIGTLRSKLMPHKVFIKLFYKSRFSQSPSTYSLY